MPDNATNTNNPRRRTTLPDSREHPRFSGISTFGRYPRIQDLAAPPDWAIYGVPFDTGVTYRPGARFGPRSIRDASQYLKNYSIEHDVDICEILSLADAGDAPVKPYDVKETLDAAAAFAATLGEPTGTPMGNNQTKLFALGGDHSIAYANIRATAERFGAPLALLHFDSHLDTVDTVWGNRWTHASPFIRAIDDGLINPKQMLSVGIKGPLNTRQDLNYAKDHGVTIITYNQYKHHTGQSTITEFVRKLNNQPTYLTFDVDCIDPAFAPGTGTPCPGGFTSAEALDLIRSLAGANIVGADVVEVLPDRDLGGTGGVTAFLAAHIAFEILALDALRRSKP